MLKIDMNIEAKTLEEAKAAIEEATRNLMLGCFVGFDGVGDAGASYVFHVDGLAAETAA